MTLNFLKQSVPFFTLAVLSVWSVMQSCFTTWTKLCLAVKAQLALKKSCVRFGDLSVSKRFS